MFSSRWRRWLWVSIIVIGLIAGSGGFDASATESGPVHVIPVEGEIDSVLAQFISRMISEAEDEGASAVILEIITLGGRVDAALDIRDAIVGSRVPVTAFVKHRAWSAGALITLACPHVVMAPGSSMGAAEPQPRDEKIVSAMKAEFEATAEASGRDPRIAAAMVDKDIHINDVIRSGQLLTLTFRQAHELGMADEILGSREEIIDSLGLSGVPVVERSLQRTERIARYIVSTTVSSILLSLGLLGLVTEITSPGLGVPGIGGLICLGLFFGGHMIAGFAGWEVIVLFILGVLLIAVEVFMPGFGVFGIGGVVAVLISIYLAVGSATQAMQIIGISLVLTIVFGYFIIRYLGKRGFWTRLALGDSLTTAEGYLASASRDELIGKHGVALTSLRPAGVVILDNNRVDATTDGGYITNGATVEVIRIEGMRLVVREVESDNVEGG